MDNLNAGVSPTGGQAASQSTGTVMPSSGTTQPNGEAGQSATGSENFLPQGVDLNTLPPAVRAELDRINKEMVRGFTTKTQKLAEDQKKYEGYDTYKQEAELYRQIAAQEEFVKQWNEHVQKINGQSNQGNPNDPNDPNAKLQAEIQQIKTQLQQKELAEVVDAFSTATDEKGEALHPEFDALNSITIGKAQNGEEYSLLRASIELAPGNSPQEKLANGYKAAKQIHEQIFEEGRKAGMGRMMAKVRNSTQAPTITSDKSAFNGDAKKLSVREARELAEKGVVVH